MVSLPRDSWVILPSYVEEQAERGLFLGGPRLLVRTIELNTGIRIDRYAEIGFAGYVGVVDAIGGVGMRLDRDVKGLKSRANLTRAVTT